jgi:hypothetical protein
MAKVGCVAHQLLAPDAQQYVKAEDFDRVVEERNALQAQVEWQAAALQKLRVQFVLMSALAMAALSVAWVVYQWGKV